MVRVNETEYGIDPRLYKSARLHCIAINNINDEDDFFVKEMVFFINDLEEPVKKYLDKELPDGVKSKIREAGVSL